MLYSYRHPDLAARAEEKPEAPPLSEQEAIRQVERRKIIRPLPVPAVIEYTDAQAADLWKQALNDSQ
jgi:hypothetical protein